MDEDCCDTRNSDLLGLDTNEPGQTKAVEIRYGAAALEKEACLCSPVSFDQNLLRAIPANVIELDYGCGDPTKWVKPGDKVLDLGSGTGKNVFICAQVTGKSGNVIGIDRNKEMLKVSRDALKIVANKIGYLNVQFLEGSIESLDNLNNNGRPLIESKSIDIVISNCVLNLVTYSQRDKLIANIYRVLQPNGRIAISDIVSNKIVPIALQKDPDLWSGCISGAWQEEDFINDFIKAGFKNVKLSERSENAWKTIDDIEFRSVTLTANK